MLPMSPRSTSPVPIKTNVITMCPSETNNSSSDSIISIPNSVIINSGSSSSSLNNNNSINRGVIHKTPESILRHSNRRSNKPIMEKRRRARINNCLNELKSILLDAMRKDPARHSKLEKADILELTVSHLKTLHRSGNGAHIIDPSSTFREGFTECIAEVGRFLSTLKFNDDLSAQISAGLIHHLADCIGNPSPTCFINNETNNNNNNAFIGKGSNPRKNNYETNNNNNIVTQQNQNFNGDRNGKIIFETNNNIITAPNQNYNGSNGQIIFETNNNIITQQNQNLINIKKISPPSSRLSSSSGHNNSNTSSPPQSPVISFLPSILPTGELTFVPSTIINPQIGNGHHNKEQLPLQQQQQQQQKTIRMINNNGQQPLSREMIPNRQNIHHRQSQQQQQQHHLQSQTMLSPEGLAVARRMQGGGPGSILESTLQQQRRSSFKHSTPRFINPSYPINGTNIKNGSANSFRKLQLHNQKQHQNHQYLHQNGSSSPYHISQASSYQSKHGRAMVNHIRSDEEYGNNDNNYNHNAPLSLVTAKQHDEVDMSCWRPW